MVRVHSSTHLKDDGAGKRKMRQFAAGKLTRNSSHTMLPRIRSNESFVRTDRPYIGRSRSSGDVIRYNKSGLRLGSLTVLGPHHKTRSLINLAGRNASLRGTKHKVIIDLGSSDNESGDESPEEVESFDDAEISQSKEKAAGMNLKKEDNVLESTKLQQSALNNKVRDMKENRPDGRSYSQVNKDLLIESVPERLRQDQNEKGNGGEKHEELLSNGNKDYAMKEKSKNTANDKNSMSYNADYLLSQSTGQEKPIYKSKNTPDQHKHITGEEHTRVNGLSNGNVSKSIISSNMQMQAVPMNQSSSSASLLFRQSGLNLASANSFYRTNRFTPARLRDFRAPNHRKVSEDQNEEKHLQKNRMSENKEGASTDSTDFSNDFSSYMANQQPELQTRTQQKLWLQRKNISSLVDIADSNNPFTTNVTRLEYEKLSREYLSIRRFSNPMLRSLDKMKEIPGLLIQKTRHGIVQTETEDAGTTLGIASREEPFRGSFEQYNRQASTFWKKYSDQFYSGKGETLNVDSKDDHSSKEINTEGSNNYYSSSRSAASQFRAMPRRYQPTTRAQQKLAASSSLNLVNLQH